MQTVFCRLCERKHNAKFSHMSRYGGRCVYSVSCPRLPDNCRRYLMVDVIRRVTR